MSELSLARLLPEILGHLSIEDPVAKRALVLSPHPDDDVLGCGGTLAKLVNSGCQVAVLYLTDGSRGDPSGKYTETQLADVRQREASRAGAILGIRDLVFLRRPDGGLRADASTVEASIAVLDKIEPELVFLPSFFDGLFHTDHLQTNLILDRIVALGHSRFTCYGYEIYTPLIPNMLVNISRQARLKARAIREHRTQMPVRSYSKVLQLNEYRAAILGPTGSTSVEAFLRVTPSLYLQLFKNFFAV